MIVLWLSFVGICIGSFINALVWRVHMQVKASKKSKSKKSKKYSIVSGRSMCVHCGHELSAKDLIPIISWVFLRGKCRYCSSPISWQYPLVELLTGLMFVISYIYWPYSLSGWLAVGFVSWLGILSGLIALAVYDIKWMLLPNRILFPLYGFAFILVASKAISSNSIDPIIASIYGIAIGGGIFYLLFQISDGRWIGGGDVKLGFLLGAIVGGPALSFLMLFLASLLGTAVSLPFLLFGKVSKTSRIPFGPFLVVASIIVFLFGADIIDWYKEFLLVD